MQFFIHCNFFCQEHKFTYLLTYGSGLATLPSWLGMVNAD